MTQPHPARPTTRLLPALLLPVLLLPASAHAQAEAQPAVPAPAATSPAAAEATPTVPSATPTPAPGAAPGLRPSPMPAAAGTPTPAEQAVLDRIRRMRDGDQRRFGSCSYRWDRWKLLADGNRTTTYSCEGTAIVDRTIGVNCSKLQINSYEPVPQSTAKGEGKSAAKGEAWAWGTWRLPKPGGEEQMVASLCANALPTPPAATGAGQASTAAPKAPPAAKR